MLTLILGGARSGKSRLAQHLASNAKSVCYLATASPVGDPDTSPTGDPEMLARIARHRADRPVYWRTVEEPLAIADAVEANASPESVLIVDCLTIWLSNLSFRHAGSPPHELEDAARRQLERIASAAARGRIILVSNEVGSGIVPEHPVSRAFRDLQGLVNQCAAALAGEVILTVAGLPLYLKRSESRE